MLQLLGFPSDGSLQHPGGLHVLAPLAFLDLTHSREAHPERRSDPVRQLVGAELEPGSMALAAILIDDRLDQSDHVLR